MQQTPFVGREAELSRLEAFWADALAGRGRVCLVTGQAGAGKSTLVGAFIARAQAAHAGAVAAVGNCDAQTGESDAYLPFLSVLEQLTGDAQSQAARGPGGGENSRRLRELVRVSLKTLVEHAPDLIGTLVPGGSLLVSAGKYAAGEAGLLGRLDERLAGKKPGDGVVSLDRDRICHQYTELLKRLSAHTPLVLVLDDMQWADSASIDLFFHLSRALASERVLVVATYRPNDVAIGRGGERHPLEGPLNELKRYHGDVWLDLDRAGLEERRALVWALLDTEPNRLDERFRRALLEHTGGLPLFAVELLRALQESGGLARDGEGRWTAPADLDWSVLPSRVEGVIEERIGRLQGDVREILTLASVEGTSFTTEVVARLREMRERDLLRVLSGELDKRHRLVVEGATEKVGARWLAQYTFSHILFQQYLYNDLSGRERMLLHGEVAGLLEELYAADPGRAAVQLARHHELAGDFEKAVGHLRVAARRALGVSAYVEARALLERARTLLDELPAGPARDQAELDVLTLSCNVVNALEGWTSPELVELYGRSRELCQALGERRQLSRVIFGMWSYHLVRLEMERSLELAREYFDLADALAEHAPMLQAHAVMAYSLYWMGRFEESRDYARAALELFSPAIAQEHLSTFGMDARVLPLRFLAHAEWALGRVDAAGAYAAEALGLAEEGGHPFSLALALYAAAALAYMCRDPGAAERHAQALHALAGEKGFAFYQAQAEILLGWVAGRRGEGGEGLRRVREGYGRVAAQGARSYHSLVRLMEAGILLDRGEPREALDALELAVREAEEYGDTAFEAELQRMRARALDALAPGCPEADAALARALERTREQGAAMLELRAAADLARRGGAAAAEALGAVLARVSAPAGNPDVEEARALLREAAGSLRDDTGFAEEPGRIEVAGGAVEGALGAAVRVEPAGRSPTSVSAGARTSDR